MRLVISLENVYSRTPDSRIWTQTMFGPKFFSRYLRVFDHVVIAARVRDVPSVGADWQTMENPRISFAPLPYYHGPLGYLRCHRELKRMARAALDVKSALILRVASPIAGIMGPRLRDSRQPFGVEVVCDPWDIFGPQGIRHPLRPYLRWHFTRQLRQQCARACAVAYVTEHAMQARYPAASNAFSVGVSDVELPPTAFVDRPRDGRLQDPKTFRLLLVGSLAQLYKGHDVLLRAAQQCISAGNPLEITMIGEGCFRPQIEALARELGVMEHCRFLGQLAAGGPVREELDRADLFVLPSRTEGLPRALVEAMARGLPSVGSAVGGIPELLPARCLIPTEDHVALAQRIIALARDERRRAQESACNLARAQNFSDLHLDAKRLAFYQAVQVHTGRWLTEGL